MRAKALQWDLYRERFPWIDEEKIFLWIDEYAYTGGSTNLRSALAYGMALSEMLRHTGFMTAGSFTTGASTMDITHHGAVLNSTGLVFKLYGEHFGTGTVPVEVTGKSPIPKPQFDVGGEHPLTIAGSETFPLDVIAGLSPDGKTLKIAVVNATFEQQRLALDLGGVAPAGRGRAWVLTGPSLTAANKFGAPAEVTISEKARADWNRASVGPLSITMFEFPVRGR
jgi:alpha-N-arabinofuranosidase